jgi:hypothetical protein
VVKYVSVRELCWIPGFIIGGLVIKEVELLPSIENYLEMVRHALLDIW